METKERGFFAPVAWITGAGKLNRDVLERDAEKIASVLFQPRLYQGPESVNLKVDIKRNAIYITFPCGKAPRIRSEQDRL